MSRTPKKRDVGVEGHAVLVASSARVVVLDAAGDPGFHPPSDIHETVDAVTIRMELPGIPAGGVRVLVQGERVEVVADKVRDHCGPDASYLCMERSFGRFYRAFELAGCLNMSRVAAVLRSGVLMLTIPKCEERRGQKRRIPVAAEPETPDE